VERRNVRAFVRRVEETGVKWNDVAVCHAHTVNFAPYARTVKRLNPQALCALQHHFACPVHLRSGRLGEVPGHATLLHAFWRRLCAEMDVHVFPSEHARASFGKMFVKGMEGPWADLRGRLLFGRWMRPFDPPKSSYVLYNGVDPRKFSPATELRHDTGLVIGCVANFHPLKGQMTLLQAVARLKGTVPELTVRFVGSGEALEDCIAYAKSQGLMDVVRFEREMPHERLADFYRSLDLFVLPSFWESFSCVCAEALACGVPVMGCRGISFLDELLSDADKQEWLVPPHDAVALAERIRKWMVRSDRGKVPTLTGNLDIDHLIGRWLDFAQSFGAYQHSGVVDDVGKPNCR
jgi:glycosyltransferase involved in cell wall biosynthesis